MIGGFNNHSTLGKTSLILAILTVVFFILSIVIIVSIIFIQNPFIMFFSSIFIFLVFIFSIIALVLGAISYWGKDRDKYGLYAFVIGLVFLILIFVVIPIAMAATTYIYVSGMIGGNEPESTPSVILTSVGQSGKNCTLIITQLSKDNIKWSDFSYTITDNTNSQEIDCTAPDNEVTVTYNYQYLEEGKTIFIYGGANNSNELKKGNIYNFNLVYSPTNSLVCSYDWTQ